MQIRAQSAHVPNRWTPETQKAQKTPLNEQIVPNIYRPPTCCVSLQSQTTVSSLLISILIEITTHFYCPRTIGRTDGGLELESRALQ